MDTNPRSQRPEPGAPERPSEPSGAGVDFPHILDPETLDPSEEPTVGAARRRRVGVDEHGRLTSGRLAGRSMWSAILVLSWPILVESMLNSLVGLTDTVLAAGLGEAETDAIGGASYVQWFIGLIIMALGVGATALVSRSVGAGKTAVANAALSQTLVLAFISGSAVGLLVWLGAGWVSDLLNMSPEASGSFSLYMGIVALGTPFTAILFGGIACARGAGDALRPLGAMVAVNVVNIFSSFALSGVDLTRARPINGTVETETLLTNPFSFDLGVLGIALGTVLAHAVGAAIILWMAASGTWGIRLIGRRLKPHWHTIRRLVRVGLPNFFETFGMWIGNFLILLMVGWIGSEGRLGAHIVAVRIEAFSFLLGFAMASAGATLAGQYMGAGSPHLARRAVWRCAMIAAVIMGAVGAMFVLFPREIVGLLTSQPIHLELTPRLIWICGWIQAPFAIAIVTRGALRGVGDVKVVMILTWITTYAIRIPMAFFISGVDVTTTHVVDGQAVTRVLIENPVPWDLGLAGIWMGLCGELAIRSVIFTTRFLQKGWERARV